MRLALALLMVGVFAGIFQVLGTFFARRTRQELSKGTYMLVAYIFVKLAALAVVFGPFVFAYAGISVRHRDTIMLGAAVGAAITFVGWMLGLLFVYRPSRFPRWWLRGSMQVAIILGAAIALAMSR
jgi:hypothetical protein